METRITLGSTTIFKVAYAKSPSHEHFIQGFDGKLKGRYLIAFLVGVEFLGGPALRQEIERELGNPHYGPDQWTDARHMVIVFDRAARAGISVERIGELVMPAYKRANANAFAGRTIVSAFEILENGYRQDTTYGGVSLAPGTAPGLVHVFRTNSPLPCEYFVGVIKGLLQCFDIVGSVHETACQWQGAHRCCFETRWSTPLPESLS
jgi:hypothetical protein